MTQPATKTVLGRVFTNNRGIWECEVKHGTLELWTLNERSFGASLAMDSGIFATGYGPTESDAILALQSTLRKMAELETTSGNTRTWCDTVGCYVDICPDGRVFVFDEFGESFEPPLSEEQKVIEAAKSARWKREMADLEAAK